jgi:hypothetical protein
LTALKYPLYVICSIFMVLTVYSVITEKPRQYKAKLNTESAPTSSFSEIFSREDEKSTNQQNSKNENSSQKSDVKPNIKPSESIQPPTNVVIAFSNNDAGGKIVLTHTKCEKNLSFVAYTTAQDGKIDYGCWTYDELYIVINWEKNGLNNYTFDRFFDMASGERLKVKHLLEATKHSASSASTHTTNTNTPVANSTNGVKK